MNGENASIWTWIGKSSALYRTRPMGYSPENSTRPKSLFRGRTIGLALGLDHDGKARIDGRIRAVRAVVVPAVAAEDVLVEDLPDAERAVAAKVELPGRDAADGHADGLQLLAGLDGPLASLEQLAAMDSCDSPLSAGTK